MAKPKNKHNKSSERPQKSQTSKKINPFEVHINREKHKVLGQKRKNDRGLPGVSREKALKKRKRTLQQEFKLQHKSNKFLDKRIGEGDVNMTVEDRFIARYAKLKAKHYKKSIYNLADDEVLTHKGQTLSEIEKFEDPRSDDDEVLDEESGRLDADFVDEAHFGGGIFKKVGTDGARSHKDLIDQLIAESKKRKAEKQKLREETLELTEKLDTEWKELLPLVNKTKPPKSQVENDKADEYDKVMRQLKFEARGIPSDRLKTEDEIAKEEKEKLELLEKERLDRMRGVKESTDMRKGQHISGDDLEDNFAYESDTEVLLSYNQEGAANVTVEAELDGKVIKPVDDKNEEESDSEGDSDDEGTGESEYEDNLSDLKQEESLSESEDEENYTESKDNIDKDNSTNKTPKDEIREDLLQRKDIMEKARQELPYIFTFPDSYEGLQALLQDETGERQYVILERIIKCNHPSLGEANKEKLNVLFAYLLQYVSDLATVSSSRAINKCFNIFTSLVPHLYDLACMSPLNAHRLVLEAIKEKQHDYRKNKKTYPALDILLFLKLISCVFSTSDFRHAVVTPAVMFIDQMLNNCKVRKRRDISFGLFLATLILEYTKLSKRFLPSAINFLAGTLHMAIPKTGVRILKIAPPFKSASNTLVLCNNYSDSEMQLKMEVDYLLPGEIDDEYRIRAHFLSLSLLNEFVLIFSELPSCCEIFVLVEKYLGMIPVDNYPEEVRNKSSALKEEIGRMRANRILQYIVMPKQPPKVLKLYEPKIEKVYDTKRHKVQSKEKAERDKLIHKLKREKKGALREIRRDKSFLGKLKIDQQMKSDNERKSKVKKLLSEASIQQSELNTMDRQKKRRKLSSR